ncbi:GmrSD restriction endonuclease domain-containing protein [Sorangium sp. So ce887]|uniref:GmrSD restriction endonuclease domain-containing protein n=1 Tax=Sorangium sp. So ce887 TaxID=3133324 RepID=UPI003F5EB2DA
MDYSVLNVENQNPKVDQHVRNVAEGRYGLPEFQRTFVWDDERVRGLWDSLYQGFPVGQIMLWTPDQIDFPMRSFGREQKEVTGGNRVAVIDGQQRLTALYLVLAGQVELRFNLERQEFTFSTGPNDLRLDILRDAAGAPVEYVKAAGRQHFFQHATPAQKETFGERINWLNNILVQREMPSQKIVGSAYSVVLDVFKRLNRQGEPLNEAQLTMSGISLRWPGVFRKTYDVLRQLNTEMGFDQAEDPSFVFLVWTAVHTGQHLVKHLAPEPESRSRYLRQATAENYEASWQRTVGGLKQLTEVMRNDLDLTNFKFVKAYYPLAVAAHYLAVHPVVNETDRTALVRWLILALVSGRYAVRGQTKYGADIKNTAEEAALRQLFHHAREPLDPEHATSNLLDVESFLEGGFRSPYVTLLYMVARRLGAVDWFDQTLRIGASLPGGGTWQFHHIFPDESFDADRGKLRNAFEEARIEGDEDEAERLRSELADFEARVASFANLAFLSPMTNQSISNRQPSEYLKEIASTPEGRAALEAQLIPMNPKLWKHTAFEDFRRARCQLLATKARELFFSST